MKTKLLALSACTLLTSLFIVMVIDMSWISGEKLSQTRLRRLSGGIPGSYTIFEHDGTYYAEANFPGGTDYSGTDKHVIVQNALDALETNGGLIYINGFTVSIYSLTMKEKVVIIEEYQGLQRKLMRRTHDYALGLQGEILGDERQCIPEYHARGSCTNAYLHEGFLILAMRKDVVGGTAGEVYFPHSFRYGTYQWKAKVMNIPNQTGWTMYVGFCEEFPSGYKDSIFVYYTSADSTWRFRTENDGLYEETVITGVTWTDLNIFKVEWVEGTHVKLWINDVLKGTHTTRVPNVYSVAFLEIVAGNNLTSNVYVKAKDWQKIS